MNIALKARMYYPLLAILLVGLLCACGNAAPATTPPPVTPQEQPPEPTGTTPDESPTSDGSSSEATDRVDLVYFHRPRRCVTCVCFEERIRHVVKAYFQDEVDSGKLTLEVVNLGDKENAAIVNKYGAFGPQLFINTVRDGADHIRNIEDIWRWGCTSNPESFDEAAKSTIEQRLKEAE